MRIVNYRLGKNEDGVCRLLRENAINYDVNLGPESISRMMREIYKLDMLAEEFVYLLAISGKRIIGVLKFHMDLRIWLLLVQRTYLRDCFY